MKRRPRFKNWRIRKEGKTLRITKPVMDSHFLEQEVLGSKAEIKRCISFLEKVLKSYG